MTTIHDIHFFWKSKGGDIDTSESCRGLIALEDTGWFEGIVYENDTENSEHFVFGIYIEDEFMELYDISLLDIPYRFFAVKEESNYVGNFYAIINDNPDGIEIGMCKIEAEEQTKLETIGKLGEKTISIYRKTSEWKKRIPEQMQKIYKDLEKTMDDKKRVYKMQYSDGSIGKRITLNTTEN